MALVFVDSFDHYQNLLLKWSSGTANYNTDLSFVRTGTQSLNPVGTSFNDLPRINFATRITMICGFAIYMEALGAQLCKWFNVPDNDELGIIKSETDGSITLRITNTGGLLAQSAPGVVAAGEFFYIEVFATFENPAGFCEVRVNGATVITFNGIMCLPGFPGVQSFSLTGNDLFNVYYDDFYLCDDSGGVNDDFLGAIQVFAILPDANETPLQWTPLSGTNFSEVNQEPPPGDTAYVFDNAIGAIDQYHYTVTGPIGVFSIKGIQHSLCARLDAAGSHTLASQINTTTGAPPQVGSAGVGSDYAFVITPWDENPNTSAAFVPGDFATTFLGPIITS